MRRALVVALVTAALAAGAAVAWPTSEARPLVLRGQAKEAPLLAIRYDSSSGRLVRLDPETLRPRGKGLNLLGHFFGWSFSPNRSRLVLVADRSGELLFVDAVHMRRVATMATRADDHVVASAWLGTRILAIARPCCSVGAVNLIAIDPARRRIVSRQPLGGTLQGYVRTRDGLVVVLGPAEGTVGPSRLAAIGADGAVRTAELDRIRSGYEVPPEDVDPGEFRGLLHFARPGLAVDPEGNRAYVVGAGAPVAVVDLGSLAVSYHDLSQPISLLGRLHEWLEPVARAKGPSEGPYRAASWLGNGLLAVSGTDTRGWLDANGDPAGHSDPTGLTIVDTRDWSARILDRGASSVAVGDGVLLAFGSSWDSASQQQGGMGLTAFGGDGSVRFHLLGALPIAGVQVAGKRALVLGFGSKVRSWIVDLSEGAVVGRDSALGPQLLTAQSQPFWG